MREVWKEYGAVFFREQDKSVCTFFPPPVHTQRYNPAFDGSNMGTPPHGGAGFGGAVCFTSDALAQAAADPTDSI
jgi:hypothetical protein